MVRNADFPAIPKSGLGTRHKSVTRSSQASHLQVRVRHPARVLNPDLAKSGLLVGTSRAAAEH